MTTIPPVGKLRAIKVPAVADTTLRNGLRVIAVRRPSVPRFEARLRIPAGRIFDSGDGVRARLLPETLLGGTARRASVEIARELETLGASMDAGADADDLAVSGGGLAPSLGGWLDLLADVLTHPEFPADEVSVARDRVAQEIIIIGSQPGTIAGQALGARLFGKHPYGRGLPDPSKVRRTGAAAIRAYHGERTLPKGAQLILVGDIRPAKAIEQVERALSGWKGGPKKDRPSGPTFTPAPLLIVNRPGAVQTNIRMGGPALRRGTPGSYALTLANLIYGGYFSSRLVDNIREDKGYTYSPSSVVQHRRDCSILVTGADVATAVSAPSLLEIRYELGKIATSAVKQEELDGARRYLGGVTALQIQTQSGLANYLDLLYAGGCGIEYLQALRDNLGAVTIDDVLAAAATHLSPRALTTVLVGDAETILPQVERLDAVEVAS